MSGTNIKASNTFGFDCSGTSTAGTKAYNKAFTLLGNTDYYDMNMLITPGIIDSLHPLVTSAARNLVEDRQDTFYVMDSNALTDNIDTVVQQVTSIDSNYTSTYWPWVRIVNPAKNVPIWVPPSPKPTRSPQRRMKVRPLVFQRRMLRHQHRRLLSRQ